MKKSKRQRAALAAATCAQYRHRKANEPKVRLLRIKQEREVNERARVTRSERVRLRKEFQATQERISG